MSEESNTFEFVLSIGAMVQFVEVVGVEFTIYPAMVTYVNSEKTRASLCVRYYGTWKDFYEVMNHSSFVASKEKTGSYFRGVQ